MMVMLLLFQISLGLLHKNTLEENVISELYNHGGPFKTQMLSYQFEVYRQLFQSKNENDKQYLPAVESFLFPWLKPRFTSVKELERAEGKGIVMCVGNKYMPFAQSSIAIIRNVWNSTIPIEVFYLGDKDLSIKNQNYLKRFTNLKTLDLLKFFDNTIIEIKEYASKPFAILASSFREIIFIDADVIMLNSPEYFFALDLYQDSRALFFKDRTLNYFPVDPYPQLKLWIKMLLSKPLSPDVTNSRLYTLKSKHEQESGLLVIDRKYHLLAMLAVCFLNSEPYRSITYSHMHGDKETFWLGFQLTNSTYTFNPSLPAAFGKPLNGINNEKYLCSPQILHLIKGRPAWINGGMFRNKRKIKSGVIDFTYFLPEPGLWIPDSCLITTNEPVKVTIKEKQQLAKIGDLYVEYFHLRGH